MQAENCEWEVIKGQEQRGNILHKVKSNIWINENIYLKLWIPAEMILSVTCSMK
jgi:hypothetical protein